MTSRKDIEPSHRQAAFRVVKSLWQGMSRAAAVKTVGAYVLDYEVRLSRLVADLFNGKIDRSDGARGHRALLREFDDQTYVQGMMEGGYKTEEEARDNLTPEDEVAIAEWLAGQLEHVGDFWQDVAVADTPEKQDTINARAEEWTTSLSNLGGIGRSSAQIGISDPICYWELGDTEKHCKTCASLDGQEHKLSWFIDKGYMPRERDSQKLECGGWRCDCVVKRKKDGKVMLP